MILKDHDMNYKIHLIKYYCLKSWLVVTIEQKCNNLNSKWFVQWPRADLIQNSEVILECSNSS